MAADSQAALLGCLRTPAAALLPADADYTRRVLRAVVLAAEQDGQEVCEELMELYSSCLLTQPESTVIIRSSDSGGERGEDGSNALERGTKRLAPPPQPGFMYKLYAYAPAGESLAATVQRLGELEHEALRRCRSRQQPQEHEDWQPPLPPLHVAAGDARHGLLALHLCRNLFEGGTGCHEWQAGFFLAEWVLSHPDLVAGRCCVEVGCGAGMVGVALHRCGASRVICSDGDERSLANCRLNLLLNGVPLMNGSNSAASASAGVPPGASTCRDSSGEGQQQQQLQQQQRPVELRRLCWERGWGGAGGSGAGGCAAEEQWQEGGQPAVILGADLLYDPLNIPLLLPLLKQMLLAAAAAATAAAAQQAAEAGFVGQQLQGQPPTAAYLATTLRHEATMQQFLDTVGADPGLSICQLAGPTGWQPGATAEAARGCGAGGAAPGDSSCSGSAAGGAGVVAEEAAAAAGGVRFQHLPELEATRGSIFLHRITLSPALLN